jgi:hypothetical protein
MFEKVQRALSTFFSSSRLYLFAMIVALVAILQLAYMYSDKFTTRDMMTSGAADSVAPSYSPALPSPAIPSASASATAPVSNPSDLLPHDVNSQWGELNPMSNDGVNTPDLLQAGYHIGLDTIGQTMRNANLQERSDPVISKSNIGPWNQSTIEPDLARTPLEIGVGPR